jgi:hypothetical protein
MRSLRINCTGTPLLTITRSKRWQNRMVYILTTPKSHKYRNGRSRIIYIGTTGKGAGRPAASAVNKASQAFSELYGVKTIEVHIATCDSRPAVKTWKKLESALIDTFRTRYFQLPRYNKVRPKHKDGLFKRRALETLIEQFEP